MLKKAYKHGVLLALQEEGLVKEAGAAHGLKTLAEDALGKVKDYFTGKGVREALKNYAEASAPQTGEALKQVRKSVFPYAAPAAGIGVAAAIPTTMGALYPDSR